MSEADFWDYATMRSLCNRMKGIQEAEKIRERNAWERTRILAYLQVDKKGRRSLEKVFNRITGDSRGVASQEDLTSEQLVKKMTDSSRIGQKLMKKLNGIS